jgi:hypothetical protein
MGGQGITPPYIKTQDYQHHFRGNWTEGGICRIRVFEADARPPVIICSELEENTNTSTTNMVEYRAAEVIARHFPYRLEYPEPVIWLEHYPGQRDARRQVKGRSDFDRVVFESWAPRTEWLGGVRRRRLGDPDWRPMPLHEVSALIGENEVDS